MLCYLREVMNVVKRDEGLKNKDVTAERVGGREAKPELGEKRPLKKVEGIGKNVGWDDLFLPKKG